MPAIIPPHDLVKGALRTVLSILLCLGTAIIFVLAGSLAFCEAHAAQFGSFAYNVNPATCDGQDNYVIVDAAHVAAEGAGHYPSGSFTIVAASVFARSSDTQTYAMLGVLGGLGDPLTPYLFGQGTAQWAITYPMQTGYQLHLHYACSPGDIMIPGIVIQYTVP